MRIILHADDLGLSTTVNNAIFDLMSDGLLTSASLLANGPAFADAAHRAQAFPQFSFGVHLNLTEFEPLQPSPALAPFLRDGSFDRSALTSHLSRETRHAVLQEWTAQVERVRDSGLPISHLDSHHHIHTRVALLPCLRDLCGTQNIHRVRLRHTFTSNQPCARWRPDTLLYNWTLRQKFTCADEFGSLSAFLRFIDCFSPSATLEVMTHPGHVNYAAETFALALDDTRTLLRQHECITYRELQ